MSIPDSLTYTFGMALVAPFGGLVCMSFADKLERKWQIVGSALARAAAGVVFATSRNPWVIVPTGGFELLSAAFNGFIVAWVLGQYGAPVVLILFTLSMLLVALAIAALRPTTRQTLETLSP